MVEYELVAKIIFSNLYLDLNLHCYYNSFNIIFFLFCNKQKHGGKTNNVKKLNMENNACKHQDI